MTSEIEKEPQFSLMYGVWGMGLISFLQAKDLIIVFQSNGRWCNDTMIVEKLFSIHVDIKASKDKLKSEIQGVNSELSEVAKSLNAVWEEVQSLQQKNKDLPVWYHYQRK